MKLKTKAIENYMALGVLSPLFLVSFIFLSGVLVPGIWRPSLLPLPGSTGPSCPCPGVAWSPQSFLFFLSALVAGGQDSTTTASSSPGCDLAGAAGGLQRASQWKGLSPAWEGVREAEEKG